MNRLSPIALRGLAGILIIVALWFGWRMVRNHYIDVGKTEVQAKWDADKAARAKAEEAAMAKRVQYNAREKERQDEANRTITENYNAEITKVRADLALASRMRVGTNVCRQGSTGDAQTPSAQGSQPADTGTRVVSDKTDRAIRKLMIDVEDALATGRACQSFLRENGFAPIEPGQSQVTLDAR